MLEQLIRNQSNLGLFLLRLTLAIIFIAHGSQKVTTMFGGSGFAGTAESFENMGLFMPSFTAYFVGIVEFFGGIFMLIGLLTREVSVLFLIVMIGAIVTVHGKNGFFVYNDGFEYNLALIGMSLCLLFGGGGLASIDNLLFPKDKWTFIDDPSKVKLEPPENNG